MADGFSNRPKILRGALVEFGLSLPPNFVVFQFNPEQLTRNRSLSYSVLNQQSTPPPPQQRQTNQTNTNNTTTTTSTTTQTTAPSLQTGDALRKLHEKNEDLLKIREKQKVSITEESISLDVRLDATDELDEGDPIVEQFGILPRLAALELMVYPKSDSLLGGLLPDLQSNGHSFTRSENPPMVLFIWGRTRIIPVNIQSMNITETEFSTVLNPTRATVALSMKVIEGKNPVNKFYKSAKDVMAILNLSNITEIADVVIPG